MGLFIWEDGAIYKKNTRRGGRKSLIQFGNTHLRDTVILHCIIYK